MKPILPFAQYDEATNHLHILHKNIPDGVTNLYTEEFVRKQQTEIEALKEENIGIKAVLDEYRTQIQAEYERK